MVTDGRDALFEGPSQVDVTVAKVVLAGWRITRFSMVSPSSYSLFTPSGRFAGEYSTRLAAAMAAEFAMTEPPEVRDETNFAAVGAWRRDQRVRRA